LQRQAVVAVPHSGSEARANPSLQAEIDRPEPSRRRAVRAGAILLADCFLLASAATDFR
jgi:hypothetical protein